MVLLNGYPVDSTGLRIWPLKLYYRRWRKLKSIRSTAVVLEGLIFDVEFVFDGKAEPIVYSAPSILRLLRLLELAIANGPEELTISPDILNLVDYLRPLTDNPETASADELLSDIDRLLTVNEVKPAREYMEMIHPEKHDTAEYCFAEARLLKQSNASHKQVSQYVGRVRRQFPDDKNLRNFYYWHSLKQTNPAIVEEGLQEWSHDKGDTDLAIYLSEYFGCRMNFGKATVILEEAILNSEDPEAIEVLKTLLTYYEQASSSTKRRLLHRFKCFILREWEIPRWAAWSAIVLGLVLVAAFFAWLTYRDTEDSYEPEPVHLRDGKDP